METTLDIAVDVLEAAQELAQREMKSPGEIISELARKGLSAQKSEAEYIAALETIALPRRGGHVVTLEIVNSLRDAEP